MKLEPETETLYQAIGERIRQARLRAKQRQEDLALRIGLSRTSVTNIERGAQRPPIHLLYLVAGALDVNVADLLPEPRYDPAPPEDGLPDLPAEIRTFILNLREK